MLKNIHNILPINIIQKIRKSLSYIKTIFISKNIMHYDKIMSYKNKDLNLKQYFDLNFEEAYNICSKNYTHEELNYMLQNGNILQKQYAALIYDSINNLNDANILLSNLTGCDGKIREAAAFKIYKLISENNKVLKIFEQTNPEIFAKATIDINANICRLVVNTTSLLKNNSNFSQKYTKFIQKYIFEAFEELDKFIFRDKKYVINKQLFKLYWCLETLQNFYIFLPKEQLKEILSKASNIKEYTIREQTAKIINISNLFPEIKNTLIDDENYYVKNVFD